ncbi:histidine phosphatase family protein [Mesorhizobium sp. B2-3-6]|nr:histidine phosphatase family protein [Mesorhizobium sp. B2-3-6]
MKQLFVLRHAKSSWDDPNLPDFDRPLAERGLKAAQLIGRELATRGWLPDQALGIAGAAHPRDLAAVDAELPAHPRVAFSEALYEASATDILSQIRQADPSNDSLLVVGHNPGLQYLAKQLAGPGSEAKARRRLEGKFPTAAFARLVFQGDWSNLSPARLTHCLRPKDLR